MSYMELDAPFAQSVFKDDEPRPILMIGRHVKHEAQTY